MLGISINLLFVRVLTKDDDAEPMQEMQVGQDQYALYFHRGGPYNTVTRNGRQVFDGREAKTGICLRLKQGADGGVALECMHARLDESILLPLP